MNKYINTDELRTEFWTPDDKEYSYGDICKILDEMTSADVVEVKYGEWVHLGGDEWACSECGNVIFTGGSWEKPYERDMFFCNNCGADMRGRKERNEEDN